MKILHACVRTLASAARWAKQLFGTVIFRAVKSYQRMPSQNIAHSACPAPRKFIQHKKEILFEVLRRHTVKHVSNVVVRWNLLHPKQRLCVVTSRILEERTLERQKRWRLHEEHGKRRNANISHRITAIGSDSLVVHRRTGLAKAYYIFLQVLHKVIINQCINYWTFFWFCAIQ